MNIQVWLKETHEPYQITAFLEQIHNYGHSVDLVFNESDLIDRDKPATLENLPIPRNLLVYIDRVIFQDSDFVAASPIAVVVYQREVNKSGIIRRIIDDQDRIMQTNQE